MEKLKLPDDFFFGAAMSGPQTEGDKDFLSGHNVHLQLLTNDAGGRSVKLSMLLMHAEDQLMEAETFRVVAENFISVYERMGKLEQ